MTVPARGDGAAADERAADGNEPVQRPAAPDARAKLVRLGGHWICSHQLAAFRAPDGPSDDVQLRS